MVGKTLLNYRITEKLGAGGQGTVYRATDERLGRTVVIKILSPELTAREVNLKRFEREAQLASSLDHPNICIIYGLHESEGVHFIAMQYIEGKDVRELVNSETARTRALFAKHIERITLTPTGEHYVASGTWDFIGRGSIDGAGGPVCTVRATEFSLPVAA